MSLLNDMLKDLDSKALHRPANVLIPSLNRNWVKKKLPDLLTWLAIIVMISCVMYTIIYKSWHAEPGVSMPKPKPVTIEAADKSSVDLNRATRSPDPAILNNAQTVPTTTDRYLNSQQPLDTPSISEEESALNMLTPEPEELELMNKQITYDTLDGVPTPVTKKMTRLTPDEWHDEHLNKAMQALEQEDDQGAVDHLTLILTQFPASIEARENLAAIYLAQSNVSRANDILNEGLKFTPHNLRLTTMKSRVLVEQGQHREALALLEQFKPDINKAPDYYGLLAAIFETLGRTNEAGSLYQTLVKIDLSNGQYWLGFGIALEKKHSRQQAIDAYIRASQSENSQPMVRSYAEDRLKVLQG